VWELPGLSHSKPSIGTRYVPDGSNFLSTGDR